jgi:predicted transcriptional regulator
MRTKKKQPLAAPTLTDAWAAVLAEQQVEDLDALRKQGWRTINDISVATGRLEVTLANSLRVQANEGILETKTIRAKVGAKVRNVRIYRPMETKCQQRANINAKP